MAQTSYTTPGVYVEIESRGPKPITPVGMSTAAFIGFTQKCEGDLGKPVEITNWTQFTSIFGDFVNGAFLPDAVYGHFANGGGRCYVVSVNAIDNIEFKPAEVKIKNGSNKDCLTATLINPLIKAASVEIVQEKDSELLLIKVYVDEEEKESFPISLDEKSEHFAQNIKSDYVSIKVTGGGTPKVEKYDFAVSSAASEDVDFLGDEEKRTGLKGLVAYEDVRLLACPDIMAVYQKGNEKSINKILAVQKEMIAQCENLKDRFAILDTPPGMSLADVRKWRNDLGSPTYAALYYPWLKVPDLTSRDGGTKLIPPSGHVIGIYNRSDANYGVHKAPANEPLQNVLDLEYKVNKAENGSLNDKGINCIRAFSGRGIRVWGARTLAAKDEGEWKYINVRRLFIMIATSLEESLQWVTFEPNNHELWAKVTRDITFFLDIVWRSGALFGQTPAEAFYVKCDKELNPKQIRDLGQLIIEVGVAPTTPAEFVIIRLSQWAGPNAEG